MALSIYKPGQGYWTRMLSAVGAGILVLWGVAWLWRELEVIPQYTVIIQSVSAAAIILIAGITFFFLFNKHKVVDFLIATEQEMRKVNWPTRREVTLSTWIVICGTFLMGFLMFAVDLFFAWFFHLIGVLEGGL